MYGLFSYQLLPGLIYPYFLVTYYISIEEEEDLEEQ